LKVDESALKKEEKQILQENVEEHKDGNLEIIEEKKEEAE